jgi:tetratricopeptide (TPR) repeat protein
MTPTPYSRKQLGRTLAITLTAALMGALVPARVAHAAPSDAVEQLIGNAEYWQERGREDRAAEAWIRVLAADPSDQEALVWLINYFTRIGKDDEAREYLDKLKEVNPKHPDIPNLERALALGERYDVMLEEARSAARAGRRDDAIAKYRELFGGSEPPVPLALEYYETLGGSPCGWAEARDGLRALVKRKPKEVRYQLALGRHLTYRDETRVEGIHLLEKLSTDATVGLEADKAWRQALIWLVGKPPPVPQPPPAPDACERRDRTGPVRLRPGEREALIAAYLAKHPDDRELQDLLKESRSTRYRNDETRDAFEALNRNDLTDAERRLDRLGQHDLEGLVGRGILALKRGQFIRARDFLEQAKTLAPTRPELWRKSLDSARFWVFMTEARAALDAAKYDLAEKKALSAIEADPDERFYADTLLAEIYYAARKQDDMEDRIRIIMKEQATDVGGLKATIQVLLKTQQLDRALALNEQIRKIDAAKAFKDAELHAAVLVGEAAREKQLSHLPEAKALLIRARDTDPAYYWAWHDLANLLMQLKEYDEAQAAAQRAAELDPDNPESHLTLLRLMEARGRVEEALLAIQNMPADLMTQEIRDMQARLELKEAISNAEKRMADGDEGGARSALVTLDLKVEGQPAMIPVVANAWATLGDTEHAIGMLQRLLAKDPQAPVRLQLAALLFKAGRDEEAVDVLAKMDTSDLTPDDRKGVENIRTASVIQHAERLTAENQFAAAAALLQPLARDYPQNTHVLCALGRLFEAGGEIHDAHAAFQRALDLDPDSMEARQGVLDNALAVGDIAEADRIVSDTIKRHPDDPRVHLFAARYWERRSDDAQADREIRKAEELARQEDAATSASRPKATQPLPRDVSDHSSTATMADAAVAKFGAANASEPAPPSGGSAIDREVQAERDALNRKYRYEFFPGVEIRYRAGVPGLGQLTEVRVPIGINIPTPWAGHLSFLATPTFVDGGQVNLNDPTQGFFFGTVAQKYNSDGTVNATSGTVFEEAAGGVELRALYTVNDFTIDFGSTPLGFQVMKLPIQGGIQWNPHWGIFGLNLELSRRPITDSVLSFAGQRDPGTGQSWGGVFKNGGQLGLSFSGKSLVFSLFGDYRYIQGTNVLSNQTYSGGAGLDWTALRHSDWDLKVGLDLVAFGYQNNQAEFTFGSGGYFSPQSFVHVGVPVTWEGASASARWVLKVEPGFSDFRTNPAAFYPLEPGVVPAGLTTHSPPVQVPPPTFGGGPSPAVDARALVTFPLARDTEGGVEFAFHAAADYIELFASFVVRYDWDRK